MFSYQISCNLRYSSNNLTIAVVRDNTPEVYTLSPLKILWDFGVVCLNAPINAGCDASSFEEPGAVIPHAGIFKGAVG